MSTTYLRRTYRDAVEFMPNAALVDRDKYAIRGAEMTNCSTGGTPPRKCDLGYTWTNRLSRSRSRR